MPLFKDTETLHIVHRQHAYNAEALDGKIVAIEDSVKCVVLQHTHNSFWSYDIVGLQINYADILWETFGNDTSIFPKTPMTFTAIIALEDLNAYAEKNNYRILKPITESVKKTTKPLPAFNPPKKTSFSSKEDAIINTASDYGVKLVRDGESSTYKFKSPNLR